MAVVVFDPFAFKRGYPEFNAVSNIVLQRYFDNATLYLSNKDNSPMQDINRRTQLLNMLVAHIGALSGALSADGQAKPVGRISQAAEGSVSISLDMGVNQNPSAAWFQQTQYGASFWQATSSLRSFRYRARRTVIR